MSITSEGQNQAIQTNVSAVPKMQKVTQTAIAITFSTRSNIKMSHQSFQGAVIEEKIRKALEFDTFQIRSIQVSNDGSLVYITFKGKHACFSKDIIPSVEAFGFKFDNVEFENKCVIFSKRDETPVRCDECGQCFPKYKTRYSFDHNLRQCETCIEAQIVDDTEEAFAE